jgi:hypothetical protein
MADEPDNIVLVYLRRIDTKLDRLVEDVRDLKIRVTGVEKRLGEVEVSIAGVQGRKDEVCDYDPGVRQEMQAAVGLKTPSCPRIVN